MVGVRGGASSALGCLACGPGRIWTAFNGLDSPDLKVFRVGQPRSEFEACGLGSPSEACGLESPWTVPPKHCKEHLETTTQVPKTGCLSARMYIEPGSNLKDFIFFLQDRVF